MTLDAQDWVWRHSRSRGNARLALLAVADAVTGPDAETRMGTAEFMRRLNVARSTARAALDAVLSSGELVEVEPAKGSRATLYRIPGAVGYTRAKGPNLGPPTGPNLGPLSLNGPESGPIEQTPETQGPESGPIAATGPNLGPSRGSNLGPLELWDEHPEKCATRAQASFKAFERMSEGVSEGRARGEVAVIPDFARPVVDPITAAGYHPAWTLTPAEWFTVDALIKRSGPDMLAAAAVQAARRARNGVSHARYFLRTWQALPPAPAAGTIPAAPTGPGADVIPLDPTAPRKGRAAQAADWYAEIIAQEQ